jgi:hypothetical protein
MAAKRGLSADIRIDNSGGVLTDISRSVKNVNFSRDAELLDATTFQAPGGDKEFIVGFKDNKFDIEGNADSVVATHLNGIAGQEATVSFQYGPEGTTAGNRRYTGEAVMVSYRESTPATGLNTFTASFQITGQVTVGVYP